MASRPPEPNAQPNARISDRDDIRFQVNDERAGRADKVLAARFPGLGRRRIAELFARGAVRIDGKLAKKGEHVTAGAHVDVTQTPVVHASAPPRPAPELPLAILYQDSALIVLDKPGGMASHPLRPEETQTLANALVARFPECVAAGAEAREAGLVHRLDAGTSGVIAAALAPDTWHSLRRALAAGLVRKTYWALVASADVNDGACDAALCHSGRRMRIARPLDAHALSAHTSWRVLERFPERDHALLECTAHTGRMHQVRVHLAHATAAIVGDALYGGPVSPTPMSGFFLHARALTLTHPVTGAALTIEAPLPEDRRALLAHSNA